MSPQVSATRSPFKELIDRLTDHRRFRCSLGSRACLQTARLIIIEVYLGPLHDVCQYTSSVRSFSTLDPPKALVGCLYQDLSGITSLLSGVGKDSCALREAQEQHLSGGGRESNPPTGFRRRTGFEDWCVLRRWSIPLTRTFVSATVQAFDQDLCGASTRNLAQKTCPVSNPRLVRSSPSSWSRSMIPRDGIRVTVMPITEAGICAFGAVVAPTGTTPTNGLRKSCVRSACGREAPRPRCLPPSRARSGDSATARRNLQPLGAWRTRRSNRAPGRERSD